MGLFKKPEAQSVQVQGRDLRCLICGNTTFFRSKAQLNTATASFLNLDWTNREGLCFICEHCGYIHWFSAK